MDNTVEMKMTTEKAIRMIDLTKNRTSAPVQRFINTLRNTVVAEGKRMHVAAIDAIVQDPGIISNYFLNRSMHQKLLGDNLILLDRVFRSSFALLMTNNLQNAMSVNQSVIPGLWTPYILYSMVYSGISMIELDGKWYLTNVMANAPSSDIEEFEEVVRDALTTRNGRAIPFDEYNPNRLYQFWSATESILINIIVASGTTGMPNANMTTNGEPIYKRRAGDFAAILEAGLQSKKEPVFLDEGTPEEIMEKFVKVFEDPLLTYLSLCLNSSGLSEDVVREMLMQSNAKCIYDISELKGGSPLISKKTKVYYVLSNAANPSMGATFSCSAADVYAMIGWDRNLPETTPSKTVYNRVGKAIDDFFKDLINYTINLCIANQ